MATHSSILAWEIRWREEPGGLQSMGSQRFGHKLATEHSTTGVKILHGWYSVNIKKNNKNIVNQDICKQLNQRKQTLCSNLSETCHVSKES